MSSPIHLSDDTIKTLSGELDKLIMYGNITELYRASFFGENYFYILGIGIHHRTLVKYEKVKLLEKTERNKVTGDSLFRVVVEVCGGGSPTLLC